MRNKYGRMNTSNIFNFRRLSSYCNCTDSDNMKQSITTLDSSQTRQQEERKVILRNTLFSIKDDESDESQSSESLVKCSVKLKPFCENKSEAKSSQKSAKITPLIKFRNFDRENKRESPTKPKVNIRRDLFKLKPNSILKNSQLRRKIQLVA